MIIGVWLSNVRCGWERLEELVFGKDGPVEDDVAGCDGSAEDILARERFQVVVLEVGKVGAWRRTGTLVPVSCDLREVGQLTALVLDGRQDPLAPNLEPSHRPAWSAAMLPSHDTRPAKGQVDRSRYLDEGSVSGYTQARPRFRHCAQVGRAELQRVLLTRQASQAATVRVCEGRSSGRLRLWLFFALPLRPLSSSMMSQCPETSAQGAAFRAP